MNRIVPVLVWEVVWKHRVVFPALALLLGLGVVLAWVVAAHGEADPWWLGHARGITVVAFLTSLLLSYAPFTLMESQSGWRMNSMTTRWFVLPVRTAVLVLLPLGAAVGFVAIVFLAWVPILGRALGPGLDSRYFLSVLVLGVVALQAVAWAVPRRPGQYWAIAGLVLPAALVLAAVPQDQPDLAHWRVQAAARFAFASAVLGGFALYAARRNRCGDWPGHVPLERLWQRVRQGRPDGRGYGSAWPALFHSDARPALRFLAIGWGLLATAILAFYTWMFLHRRPGVPFGVELFVYAAVHLLPMIAVYWLAVWGLSLGCEPGSGFRTQLSGFRATLPVGPGDFAGPRLLGFWSGWLVLWLPVVALALVYLPNFRGPWDHDGLAGIRANMAWQMAVSAHVLAGALPLLWCGRLEGFPNLLLVGICAWAGTGFMAGFLGTKEPGLIHWIVAWVLAATKIGVAGFGLAYGWQRRVLDRRYAAVVALGWLLAAAVILAVLPATDSVWRWRLMGVLLLVPLARLALCPLAVAANTCR